MQSFEDIERAQRQRDFFLKLVPQGGQYIAARIGGFAPPGIDSQEQELKDSIALWIGIHNAGAFESIADASWWMTKFMDPENRLSRTQAQQRSDELISFAVATIGQLMDSKVLQWVTPPEMPELQTSTHNLNDEVDKALLDRLDASWDED